MKIFRYQEPFGLEAGGVLKQLEIAYHTYGTLNSDRSNVVWVCHGLTANSDVEDWWPHTVESGRFLDPGRWFVVCANIIGSHYGTTGPLSTDPDTGKPYYHTFPLVSIRDMARANTLLASHLGIRRIHALVGSSVGGFQALEWIAGEPERFDRLILIATDAKASPWTIAIDETQRMAIKADQTYGEPSPEAGKAGLAAARAIGLLTYRGGSGYNISQKDMPDDYDQLLPDHRACSYQRYQGEKLCRRFDAYSYMSILNSFDTHDVGRGRGGVAKALGRVVAETIVIGISTDIIFTPEEMRALAGMFPDARYVEIDSPFGHDGFLVEHEKLNEILIPFVAKGVSAVQVANER